MKIAMKGVKAPLIMFPEGTVSNGNQLLTFKKGAFKALLPVKILMGKYESNYLKPYHNAMLIPHDWFLLMCSPPCKLTVFEFEGNYDPSYLNLDPNDENSWKIYAEKVREIMSICLEVPKLEKGFRDVREFQGIY